MKMVTPVNFKAGGKSPKKKNGGISSQKNRTNSVRSGNVGTIINHQMKKEEVEATGITSQDQEEIITPNNMRWIQAGLHRKQSPLSVKNWIATVLTLDGRDKFTKVLQYLSRLLCWYFAVLASRRTATTGSGDVGGLISKEKDLYQAISTRFNSLYKSLVTSRKAFHMGRSIIEWEKIKSMGWGYYLGYLLRHPLEEGGANALTRSGDDDCRNESIRPLLEQFDTLDTHPISEEDEEDEDSADDDSKSWISEEKDAIVEEKKDDSPSEKSKKVISRPDRPVLPSRISSNIGWGPINTTEDTSSSSESHNVPPTRTVSEMGRQMYRPNPPHSIISHQHHKKSAPSSPPTPAWKLIGGTLKLFGLMGHWAFDNIAFLTTSGFLDPFHGDAKSHAVIRTSRKKLASEYATRCHFTGSLAGLYVNLRSFWIHRNGALANARRMYHSDAASKDKNQEDGASLALKKVEQKHFELFLALLKSVCDVTVFSNNPGIDLHLKLRGKKNHEGFHCLCGLISASTVLYNNFPNNE